ncbi:MAG: exonuclease domain-containing protein [Burkholderiales bacterium]
MLDEHVVFVDLETTGATATHDRITEIGIIEVNQGRLIGEWSTLVNPEMSIPPMIQSLTGITNTMVALAPSFAEIQREVLQRLEGKLFVAHNARFDYGFLKNEFRRCGITFNARVLCTVKLSRKLYPQHPRHNLDTLLERHGLDCEARHRALGDAKVLWLLAQKWAAEHGPALVQSAVDVLVKSQSVPAGLPDLAFDNIPQAPGVYFFYGDNDVVLYVGKSVNMRSRVMSHFSGDHRVNKDMRIAQQIKRIDWKQTAGELGALLLESRLVKQLAPVHNRQLRRHSQLCAWHWRDDDSESAPRLATAADIDPAHFGDLYGLFRSRATAIEALREIAATHGLCNILLGMEKREGSCFAYQIKRCHGACVGLESRAQHALRLKQALVSLRTLPWPYGGRIAVREMAADGETAELHILDRWCHLGTVRSETELHDLIDSEGGTTPAFDVDTYKILKRFLAKPPHGTKIIRLAA